MEAGAAPKSPAAGTKVLVVDDEPAMLAIIQATLEGAGCQVEAAADGLEAVEKASRFALDLLVVDLMMPRLGGAETIQILRSLQPGLPVVVVSGLGKDEICARAPEAAIILQKPFSILQLLAAAGKALQAPVA
jgi:CheY-like chemotaxis protein